MAFRSDGSGSTTAERWDRITRQLSAEPRRSILVSLSELSDEQRISVWDAVKSAASDVSSERLRIQLLHHHLPMLEDAGYVRWWEEPFTVECGPNFQEVESVLEVLLTGADGLPKGLVSGCAALEHDEGSV